MVDRQLLIDAHKELEKASECLRREMLYLATLTEARGCAEKCAKLILKLENQLADEARKVEV